MSEDVGWLMGGGRVIDKECGCGAGVRHGILDGFVQRYDCILTRNIFYVLHGNSSI